MPEMEQEIGVNQHVVIELRGRSVTLSQESGAGYQLSGINPIWVARGSKGGLMPGLDPAIALRRFVQEERTERMAGAAIAFGLTEREKVQ